MNFDMRSILRERDEMIAKAHDLYGDVFSGTLGGSLAFTHGDEGGVIVLFNGEDVTDRVRAHEINHETCPDCDNTPCILDNEGKQLFHALWDTSRELHATQQSDPSMTSKKIRFALYRIASGIVHGRLGKGVRKELPKCVVDEIHLHAPKEEEEEYVGFKANKEHE